ncbi:helix-turn-helix domain-containing protein [Paenibacillus sp. LMG 31456]|uniref:Helix-turn-helix domain-containing protein n=1 Tax=Paenibacillus foliorum TaxID=2654974 RepID=A0A972JZ05_9BACL|nr:helix-turn-helix domain-containing protein [Paenibacillus foliorum]NOU92245.1 helix-turn-helix domain-containing protein [Paenibacillus foliorum]
MKNERIMLGVTDIMKKMGIGRDRAYEIMKKGEFPSIKVGRRFLVHEQVFDSWLKGEILKK